ncbi:MAG: 3-dehydroquinate synthase [Deltaproteobacteria bacterium]|nr:3-dehydroquinate synthase [Deltaproteobacteria bacterium]
MRTITVELGERSYPIIIKGGLLSEIGERMKDLGFRGKAAVVTNTLVGGLYGEELLKSLKEAGFSPFVITLPDGEEYKTIEVATTVYDGLIDNRMERSSPIIALGGGVIGDMAGFVAATYLRGVPYIQAPTTLLAQVDSSVGGKTAVNHPKGKNLIGAFYQPRAVFIDPQVLKSLDIREVRAGLAEVIKYGVIWDEEFFAFLEKNSSALLDIGAELTKAIERSCEIKAEVVGADETEQGVRSFLNLGHTFGHAIEALSGYGTFKHGEAVATGMALAARLSVDLGLCEDSVARSIKGLITSVGLPTEPPEFSAEQWIESMRLDKKVTAGAIWFVLIKRLGTVNLQEVGERVLKEFFARL